MPGKGEIMSVCSYIYDSNGFRWEEGSVLVDLMVNGEMRKFAVVLAGRGASRIERFEDRTHPLDGVAGKVFGEISLRDLERLVAGSQVEFLRDRVRHSISVTGARLQGGAYQGVAYHGVSGVMESFPVEINPSRARGAEGRAFDPLNAQTTEYLGALPQERRRALALAQVATMPKSGRAGGHAARRRLQTMARELIPSEFAVAAAASPDALLHVTPFLLRDMTDRAFYESDAGRPAEMASLRTFVEQTITAPPAEGANVVLASLFVLKLEGGAQPEALPGSIESLRTPLVDRIATEVLATGADARSFEFLATNPLTTAEAVLVFRKALVTSPSRLLTPATALFLERRQEQGTSVLLDMLVKDHPAQVLYAPGFFECMPVEYRLEVVRREPRLALERLELDRSSEEIAVIELRRRGESVPQVRVDVVRAQRLQRTEEIRACVDNIYRKAREFESSFAGTLRRLRHAELSTLERDRLMAYGGVGTTLREFSWSTLRRLQDLATRLEMYADEIGSPYQSPAGPSVETSRLIEALRLAESAVASLRTELKGSLDAIEALRAQARDGQLADFCVRAERALTDVPVAIHRYLGEVSEAVDVATARSAR
jgi:hypothetical protein